MWKLSTFPGADGKCPDELAALLQAYHGRCSFGHRHSRKGTVRASAVKDAQRIAEDMSLNGMPLLGEPPGVSALAALAESTVRRLDAKTTSHIRPVVHRMVDIVQGAMAQSNWSVHDLFAHLLVPTLAYMRLPKSRAFGVLLATMKLLWRTEDWPDPFAERSSALHQFVMENFIDGPDLLAGAWLLAHLRLDRWCKFDTLFEDLCANMQALRMYCTSADPDMQHALVSRIITCAAESDHRKRRQWLAFAADLIVRCGLEKNDFPMVARQKAINWMCYMVHKLPVHSAWDYALGDAELMALCVDQLVSVGKTEDATELYHRHKDAMASFLKPVTRNRLHDTTPPTAKRLDNFGPTDETTLRLMLARQDVVWVDTPELVGAVVSAARLAPLVGIDMEWSSIGDWLDPSLALLQLATPSQVFLVDLMEGTIRDAVGQLLRLIFGSESPLVLCFSFENDLRELIRSPWANDCKERRGLFDLQLHALGAKGRREGLASLVARTLHKSLSKAEQRSCWHRRPLRAAQAHYAALDAFVLLQVGAAVVGGTLTEPECIVNRLLEAQ